MKYQTTFIMSMTLTALIFSAGHLVNATDTKLFSGGKTTIDACSITGELIRKNDGVYARFIAKNETNSDTTADFHYMANRTPGSSMMSRMMPMPEKVKTDQCKIKLAAGENKTVDILVKANPEPVKADTEASKLLAELKIENEFTKKSPDSWSLIVSKQPIESIAGWGAVMPVKPLNNIELKNGTVVLDSGNVTETNNSNKS